MGIEHICMNLNLHRHLHLHVPPLSPSERGRSCSYKPLTHQPRKPGRHGGHCTCPRLWSTLGLWPNATWPLHSFNQYGEGKMITFVGSVSCCWCPCTTVAAHAAFIREGPSVLRAIKYGQRTHLLIEEYGWSEGSTCYPQTSQGRTIQKFQPL